jgi:hypothetical protein
MKNERHQNLAASFLTLQRAALSKYLIYIIIIIISKMVRRPPPPSTLLHENAGFGGFFSRLVPTDGVCKYTDLGQGVAQLINDPPTFEVIRSKKCIANT